MPFTERYDYLCVEEAQNGNPAEGNLGRLTRISYPTRADLLRSTLVSNNTRTARVNDAVHESSFRLYAYT